MELQDEPGLGDFSFTSLNSSVRSAVHNLSSSFLLFSFFFSLYYRFYFFVLLDFFLLVRLTKTSSFFVRSPRISRQDRKGSRECTVHHSTTVNKGPTFLNGELSLEHHEEAVVQFLDASCLALPVRFQQCATPRFEG